MKTYTYSEARQKLASLLDAAVREGEVRIYRRGGQVFAVLPVAGKGSPLDVPGVSTGITTREVVDVIRSERSRARAPRERSRRRRVARTTER